MKIVTIHVLLVLAQQTTVAILVYPHTSLKMTNVLKYVQMEAMETKKPELVTNAKILVKLV